MSTCHYTHTSLPGLRLFHPSSKHLGNTKKQVGNSSGFLRSATVKNSTADESSSLSIRSRSSVMTKPLTKSLVENDGECIPGKFGKFGGRFVPETLNTYFNQLENEFSIAIHDTQFQKELSTALRDFGGRETPLYYAEKLTDHYKKNNTGKGPEIYLKREDLNHLGGHSINNAIPQAMIAKRMGRKTVVAATGSGQNGVATAAACAKLNLECIIVMGKDDVKKQSSNVDMMKLFDARVKIVDGSIKEATSEAIREWFGSFSTSYYLSGSVVGPHPKPTMVREFQSIIGKETRRQAMEKWGGKPDVLIACVGGGSNALGLFHEFVNDEEVRLIGVEAAGLGLDSGKHSATLALGEVGVYHGTVSYLLQDEDGLRIDETHSIGVGMQYPAVGPEISYLKDTERAEFYTIRDTEAILAYRRLCQLEGIMPSLEASHALAFLDRLCPTLPNYTKVVVNCSGRGDKDAAMVLEYI